MKKTKILLVDDEEIVLAGWQEVLESSGYDVRTALSGREALEIAYKEKPDIVFTDLVMPDMNGIEVCKKIKSEDRSKEIIVVMITGMLEETLKERSFEAGADHFLRKPCKIEDLYRIFDSAQGK